MCILMQERRATHLWIFSWLLVSKFRDNVAEYIQIIFCVRLSFVLIVWTAPHTMQIQAWSHETVEISELIATNSTKMYGNSKVN